VSAITQSSLLAEKPLFLPGDKMGNADFNWNRAPGARVFLRCISDRDVLNDEGLPATDFDATTSRGSTQLEGHMFVAFRTIAPGH
jgi:hypothetical protein